MDQVLQDKQQARSQAFEARVTRGGAPPRPLGTQATIITNQPTITMTSGSISTAKQITAQVARESMITVCVEVRTNGKIDSLFGSWNRGYSDTTTMAGH